jgi:two-component system, chemotaxis family, CheB/CheR fusion protein
VSDGEDLLLIFFIDEPAQERSPSAPDGPQDGTRIAELEQDLEATRAELQGAIHNLELSNEEQKRRCPSTRNTSRRMRSC